MNKILFFQEDYRFLSNFEGPEVRFGALWYPKPEHAYQAAKSLDMQVRMKFIDPAITPGQAKKMGSPEFLAIRPDWDAVKCTVMQIILRQKFLHPMYMKQLLNTDDAYLEEGNMWHDQFWGNCHCHKHKNTPGMNMLGLGIMGIRTELQGFKMIFDQRAAVAQSVASHTI